MHGVEALPLVHGFAQSDKADERALFVRVYRDLKAEAARLGAPAPLDWDHALRACLAHAGAAERDGYLDQLSSPPKASRVAHEDDPAVGHGSLDAEIALAAERRTRLRPDLFERLAQRGRALARLGDRRLVEALLSREPIRMEAAPLFLEASPAQRRAILLAAQRAVLGRRGVAAPALDEAKASRLEYAALAGERGAFVAALGAALGADAELAGRIAEDPAGEPLAVALIALGAPRDVAVRIMTSRDMQNGEGFPRVHVMARLGEQLHPAAARRIVAAVIGAPPAPVPAPSSAAQRAAAHPSPFVRREVGPRQPASPETSARPARDSRTP